MKEIFLKPGEIAFSKEPARITTVLGSCIAVSIFDKKQKSGGMCHYYLPYANSSNHNANKYGEFAIINLLKKFKEAASSPKDLEAKIIGGGNVINVTKVGPDNIGSLNAQIAREKLGQFKIKIVAESIGGVSGRKIRLYTDTGKVDLKKLGANDNEVKATSKYLEETRSIVLPKEFTQPKIAEKKVVAPKIQPRKNGPINVLIVDDSKSMRMILRKMIEKHHNMKIMAEAENAEVAQQIINKTKPDVITLDINMPGMDGVSFLKSYMPKTPIPTIMISSLNKAESGPVFESLESGAFDYIKKPSLDEIENLSSELHEVIKAAFNSHYIEKRHAPLSSKLLGIHSSEETMKDHLIAIGASTGGTEAIKDVLIDLPANVPPIVITQHIPPVFSAAFADRLNTLCKFSVKEAEDGDELLPGKAFVAPGGKHMKIVKQGPRRIIKITEDPPVNRFRPSVDYMFDSISQFTNDYVIGILLTGMGADGAKGLLKLRNNKAYTIAQDEATSTVYGMPKVAADIGAAMDIVALENISSKIANYLNKK